MCPNSSADARNGKGRLARFRARRTREQSATWRQSDENGCQIGRTRTKALWRAGLGIGVVWLNRGGDSRTVVTVGFHLSGLGQAAQSIP